jgi:hypothetical protein
MLYIITHFITSFKLCGNARLNNEYLEPFCNIQIQILNNHPRLYDSRGFQVLGKQVKVSPFKEVIDLWVKRL